MTLITKIKKSEGFRGVEYFDHLGNPTIGYGTLLPLSEKEAELILQHRLSEMIKELTTRKPEVIRLSQERQEVLYEMAYQMGIPNLMKFKKMWFALEDGNFSLASIEMLDSRWHKQTPERAEGLAEIMKWQS